MRYFLLLLSAGLFIGHSSIVMAYEDTTTKIKLYTLVKAPPPHETYNTMDYDADISMMINGKLMQLQNQFVFEGSTDSYVEVESSLDSKEISQAQYTYLRGGHKYQCVANNLPLYVQKGPIYYGTTIQFDCI